MDENKSMVDDDKAIGDTNIFNGEFSKDLHQVLALATKVGYEQGYLQGREDLLKELDPQYARLCRYLELRKDAKKEI